MYIAQENAMGFSRVHLSYYEAISVGLIIEYLIYS